MKKEYWYYIAIAVALYWFFGTGSTPASSSTPINPVTAT